MPKNINYLFFGSITMVILAGVLAIFYVTTRETELDELFDKYFETYRPETNFGESQDSQYSFAEAMRLYQARDFGKSGMILKSICAADTAKAIHFFYLGNSLLALDKPKAKAAKTAFREVFKRKDAFIDKAQWYFGLACLKTHEEAAALNILWEIARKENGFKKQEARKIVDKLLDD